jgi:chromosome segregation ATPase
MDAAGSSGAGVASACASPDSQLSMDDLVGAAGDDAAPSSSFGLDTTKRVEAKLQLNLQQQHEHYARQRKLFEALGRDSLLDIGSSSPKSEAEEAADDDDDDPTRRSKDPCSQSSSTTDRARKFKLHFAAADRVAQSTNAVDKRALRRASESDLNDDEDDHVVAVERLQRKAKSIASYHARIANSGGSHYARGSSSRAVPRSSTSLHRGSDYESSNDALRKQLELLRRLQLENNRFRHENRSLREQNDVLDEQTTLHTREIKRLQDDVQELSLRVQHDQLELATAAQNLRKMKQLQKQLDAVQSDYGQLQVALQDAKDQDAQLRLRTQSEIESVVQENKHLKRSLKQTRVHEARLQEQLEEVNHTVTVREEALEELRRQLLAAQRETSEMATKLSDKTSRIESIESSATQCVERMEAGMEALQKAHATERDKRKQLEKLRDSLQSEMATLEATTTKLQARVDELEAYTTQLQHRVEDAKREKKHEKKSHDEQRADFQERQKTDAKTIARLRDECAAYEQQLESARLATVEVRKEVASESNALRKDVETLRNYMEDAQRASVSVSAVNTELSDSTAKEAMVESSSSLLLSSSRAVRREELWSQLPELQFLQGAVGGLRNEAMNFVGEFQRTRHQLRQCTAKVSAAHERVVELEHLRSEDAIARKELVDQRLLAEQAREITLREKMEVLAWSQQACEKSERLEAALAKCTASVQGVIKKTRRVVAAVKSAAGDANQSQDNDAAREPTPLLASKPGEDAMAHATRLVLVMESETQELSTHVETLVEAHKAIAQESTDRQQRIGRLQNELEAQRQDHAAVVAEIEALHTRTIAEKQQLFTNSLRAVERERETLQQQLDDEHETVTAMQTVNDTLAAKVRELEQDAPVLAALAQLLALVVPPLLLQVNDLLTQKRLLVRENTEYAMAHEQVECIGQVLRELVPASVQTGETLVEQQRRQRRRKFRRVVIAVFAINRFQRGGFVGSTAGTGESVYGVAASLKPSRKKKGASSSSPSFGSGGVSSSCLPPPTMIKVLASTPPEARTLLERLSAMDLPTKLSELTRSPAADTSCFGSLLVHILSVMEPAHKEVLVEDTAGVFHCRALLERRKTSRWQDPGGGRCDPQDDVRLSTVDLIRKRILALGKRLEDLHYQRNALQKENYDLQFQLEKQATQLTDMGTLAQKNSEMDEELHALHEQLRAEATAKQRELAEKDRLLGDRQQRLAAQHDQILRLEEDAAVFETRISALEIEKTELHHALLVAQSATAKEEEKLHKSQLGSDRQADEVRSLKQAAKRAHELHERVAWQLEQELAEKASLQAAMDRLRNQKETLEREVARANVRALDESIDGDETGEDHKSEAKKTKVSPVSGLAGSSSSSSSYERQLQDLTDRIASMRAAASIPTSLHDHEENDGKSPVKEKTSRSADHSFRSEWQRLDISGVFDEPDQLKRIMSPSQAESVDDDEASTEPSPARRRGDEIDKVDSAVHDYMDRIDDKLQQMYGIPKSSNRQRTPSAVAVIHGTSKLPKTSEVRWGDGTAFE